MPESFSHQEWEKLLEETIVHVRELSALKGGEYASDTDRLANFRRNAEALGLPMTLIWGVYAAKHWDAIMQFLKDKVSGKSRERMEPIEGRVDDLIVYLLLFKAILKEPTSNGQSLYISGVSKESYAKLPVSSLAKKLGFNNWGWVDMNNTLYKIQRKGTLIFGEPPLQKELTGVIRTKKIEEVLGP